MSTLRCASVSASLPLWLAAMRACNTGQQCQAFVRSGKVGQHVGSVGFAVRLQQKGCRMSLRCDSANQIIVPFGGIRRQEECRLPACVMQIVQNSRRVFVRRAVIGRYTRTGFFAGFSSTFGISMVSLSTGFAGAGLVFVLLLRSDPEVLSL